MSTRVFARALHTSRVTLEAAADAAASAAAPAKRPNRAQRTKADPKNLGFSATTRTRALPSLDLPSSSRRPVRRNQQPQVATEAAEGKAAGGATEAPLETPIEFFEGSQFAPVVEGVERMSLVNDRAPREAREAREAREPRAPRGPRPPRAPRTGAEGSGDRVQRGPRAPGHRGPGGLFVKKTGAGVGGAGGVAKRNDNRRFGRGDGQFGGIEAERREVPARAQPFEREARDTSLGSLFGRSSIVAPAGGRVRGAGDAAESFWAKGMEPVDARTADILRLHGAYDLLLPPAPKKGETGADAARSAAVWHVGMNPTVSMRNADKFKGILKTLL